MDQDDIDRLWSDHENDPSDYDEDNVTCNRCGKTGLWWLTVHQTHGHKNVLCDGDKRHYCNPVSDDEFEDYT